MVTVRCQQCRKPFETYPVRVKQGKAKYCSPTCYAKSLESKTGAAHHRTGVKHRPDSIAKMRLNKLATALRGPANPKWKGGTHISRGYVMVSLALLSEKEQRQFKAMATRSSGMFLPEHRLVVARKLGRPLLRTEIVHHRNGNKQDNRLSNLEIQKPNSHTQEHQRVLRELRRLRRENEELRSELSKFWNATSRKGG